MSLRLLPFRQYDENDVINIFSLATGSANNSTTDVGAGDNGVFVKISDGNFNQDIITYGPASYLGKTDYPHVFDEAYPINPLTLTTAGSGDVPLGITLNQTAREDENGEKLLYNATKREELQTVLPGQSVPVATKGIFTLSANAFDLNGVTPLTTAYSVGDKIKMSTGNAGKITGVAAASTASMTGTFGSIIGTGLRTSNAGITDQFAGNFLVIKLDA
jgi:hypothetical protein